MPLAFPLAAADFWDKLPIEALDFDLGEAVESVRTAGGETVSAERGTRLWLGEATLGAMTQEQSAEVLALLALARSGRASFLMWDIRRRGPRLDPGGGFLGAAAPQIATVTADRLEFTSTGWPGGYILQPGDLVGFAYGTAPARRALHRCVTGATASLAGAMPAVQVEPPIRPVTLPINLSVLRPEIVARIAPGSFEPGKTRHGTTRGVSFAFSQSLP